MDRPAKILRSFRKETLTGRSVAECRYLTWALALVALYGCSRDVGGDDGQHAGSARVSLTMILDTARAERIGGLTLTAVTAARSLGDGGIAFTDDGEQQLVLLDSTLTVRARVGRRGDGPGEFRGFRALWRCADDTLVVRSGTVGIKVFDGNGTLARVGTAPLIRGALYGVSNDCAALAIARPSGRMAREQPDSMTLLWYDVAQDSVTDVTTVSLQPTQTIEFLGERVQAPVPFAANPEIVVHNDHLYVGSGATPEVRVYDRSGTLSRVVQWRARPEPLTAEDREQYEVDRRSLDARIRPGTTARTPILDGFTLPTVKPLYSRLIVDSDGQLWVRKYPGRWEGFERLHPSFVEHDPEWWVFDATGRLLGEFTTPRDLMIRGIEDGRVIGVRLDANDVPHLLVVPIREISPVPAGPI